MNTIAYKKEKPVSDRLQMYSYGMGDFAVNGFNTIISSYLLFFYTDVVCLNMDAAGSIVVLSRTLDALLCILVGILLDRTVTRWGKARPIMILGAVPCGVFVILSFLIPPLKESGITAYLTAMAVMYSISYALVNVPYSSMLSSLTSDPKQRLSYNRVKSFCSSSGAVLVTLVFLPLSRMLGGGELSSGIIRCVIIFSVMNVVILFNCFMNTRETITTQTQKVSLKEGLRLSARNPYWMILCILGFLLLAGNGMRVQGTMYFAEYYLGSESAATILLSINTFMPIPIALIVPYVAGRLGKKKMVLSGNIIMLIGMLLMGSAGKHIPLLVTAQFVIALGWGFASGIIFVMIADVVDYTEKKTGMRVQGFQTSTVTLMMKLGIAFTSFVSAKVLTMGGYVQGTVQSDTSIMAIRMVFIYIPMIIVVLTAVTACFYSLNDK